MKKLSLPTFLLICAIIGLNLGFIFGVMTNKHDYQMNIKGNTVKLYDGSRYVGKCQIDKIDSLIINDNQ